MMDDASKPKKRMGRPPKPAAEVKRRGIAFRVNDKLYGRIHEDAQENQRSIAEEVEYRLQIAADISPVLDAMATDKPTKELFRTLARSLKAVRTFAARGGLDEIQTRTALKAAFDLISEINFWTGGEISPAPDDYIQVHNAPPKKLHERSPEVIGYSIASDGMVWGSAWDECVLMEDFGDVIGNHWSGDGKTAVDPEPQNVQTPSRSLEDIMAEVNPRDRKPSRKNP